MFNTIGVSDGISMGTPGMRFSLSRDVIADSVETVVQAYVLRWIATVVGCYEEHAWCINGDAGKPTAPAFLVYGGTIASGCHNGKELDVVSALRLGEKSRNHRRKRT